MMASSHKTALLLALMATAAQAGPPRFTPQDALQAEWRRQAPRFTPAEVQQLPEADRKLLDLSLKRIGAPGAPALLPPELAGPSLPVWEERARLARTPQERFTALFFLNRLKSPHALAALEGLEPGAAQAWPRALRLEGQVVAARLKGGALTPGLKAFLEALRKAGKEDPERAAAAHLRLVLAGLEPGRAALPSPIRLPALEAWNRGPWDLRATVHLSLLERTFSGPLPTPALGLAQRLLEGLPPQPLPPALTAALKALQRPAPPLVQMAALDYLQKLPALDAPTLEAVTKAAAANASTPLWPGYLALLRKHAPAKADLLANQLLAGPDPLARAAALETLPHAPEDLEPLLQRLWSPAEYDGVQTLLGSLERWQLPEPRRRALLERLSQHPCWTARLDAYQLLVKSAPATPWPLVPPSTPAEEAIFKEAQRLAAAARPVRLRLHFRGNRQITLRLDPVNAPINVANLTLLARKGFFNGRRVPRVVPDFVVQMGSPVDTMDGGPGYTVRCENSLDWYGPGSVGMALSGKDTGGSQFFITTNAAPHLTGRYTRIGAVENAEHALPLLDRLELGARILRAEVVNEGRPGTVAPSR
jgi:cyclophilin family peptidyl-prolyl cis-trans isomerase